MSKVVNINKDAISMKDAAAILGVPYHTAYKWIILEGKISYYDYGKIKRPLKSSVEAFMKQRLVKIKSVI